MLSFLISWLSLFVMIYKMTLGTILNNFFGKEFWFQYGKFSWLKKNMVLSDLKALKKRF